MTDQHPAPTPRWAWVDGEFVAWDEARIHVDTQGALGGLNAYEVIGGFWSDADSELYLFRASDHLKRLSQSSHVMRIPSFAQPETDVVRLVCELVCRNRFECDVLVRVVHYLGAGPLFSYRSEEIGSGLFLIAKPANPDTPFRRGIHIATSHWTRLGDAIAPPRVKSGANYQNVRLAQVQAQIDGYDDAVLLNSAGKVCELPLANIFLVRGGRLITPSVTSGILEGITRDAVLRFAGELGVDHEERDVDRSELYVATEIFATGTGREVWPIVSVDRFQVGDGRPGRLTDLMQQHLHAVMRNRGGHKDWLTPVYAAVGSGRA